MTTTSSDARSGSISRGRAIGLALIAAVIAFAAGAGWQYIRAERLDDRLGQMSSEHRRARLEAMLAGAVVEAQQGNAELARQHASAFFTELQQGIASDDRLPPSASELLTRRDETITMLSRGNPDAVALLRQLYVRFRAEVSRSTAQPPPSPARIDSA